MQQVILPSLGASLLWWWGAWKSCISSCTNRLAATRAGDIPASFLRNRRGHTCFTVGLEPCRHPDGSLTSGGSFGFNAAADISARCSNLRDIREGYQDFRQQVESQHSM
jgi:hypothetical protein